MERGRIGDDSEISMTYTCSMVPEKLRLGVCARVSRLTGFWHNNRWPVYIWGKFFQIEWPMRDNGGW